MRGHETVNPGWIQTTTGCHVRAEHVVSICEPHDLCGLWVVAFYTTDGKEHHYFCEEGDSRKDARVAYRELREKVTQGSTGHRLNAILHQLFDTERAIHSIER